MLRDLLEERKKRRCEESLHEFFLQAWPVLEPNWWIRGILS
jgi:hypothetical protein